MTNILESSSTQKVVSISGTAKNGVKKISSVSPAPLFLSIVFLYMTRVNSLYLSEIFRGLLPISKQCLDPIQNSNNLSTIIDSNDSCLYKQVSGVKCPLTEGLHGGRKVVESRGGNSSTR